VKTLSDNTIDGIAKFWIIASTLGLAGFLAVWGLTETYTDVAPTGLTVRSLFRTRRIAWADVQDIRVKGNPGQLGQDTAPTMVTVVHLSSGRPVLLPHVNDKNLEGEHLSLDREVAAIHSAWVLGRGEGWAPIPAVQLQAAEYARYLLNPWMLGFVWATAAFCVAIPVYLVGLASGLFQENSPWQLSFSAIVALAGLVFAMVVTGSIVRRRQRRAAVPWSSWVLGVVWGLSSTVYLVLFYAGVVTGVVNQDPPLAWLLPPTAFAIPVLVFLGATISSIVRRRSRTVAGQRAKPGS
jgi:hypothetical protein